MAKTVFRPNEIKSKPGDKVMLKLLRDYTPEVEEEVAPVDEYTGPTADDLRKEAEAFKTGWEIEKRHMLEQAQLSADEIVKKAEDAAFAEVKKQSDQAQIIKTQAEQDAQAIINKARSEAEQIINNANLEANKIKDEAYQLGIKEGQEKGFSNGQEQIDGLISRMHRVIEGVMNRREEILRDTEQQIIDIVILMTRKVVKIISENQKGVVANNVLAALKKVKTRCNVVIRVNLEDLKLTTDHIKDFIQRVEAVQGITVIEDSTVDVGGCIVETDFGAIDARIASQLGELENKVLEMSPEKTINNVKSKPLPEITERSF